MGYDENFLDGFTVKLPTPSPRVAAQAYDHGNYIHHSRYSLLFNKVRGFAFCSAHNIDGVTLRKKQISNRAFKADPKITPKILQVENERGYYKNPWDRGHLARRKSLSCGENVEEIKQAELESDFYSNIVPQHENLHDDSWGKIEDWMLLKLVGGERRACVFTGPIFTEEDPPYQFENEDPIQIPAGFWKVIVVPHENDIKSASFLVWQRDYNNDAPLKFAPILEQVRLTTIEVLTGLSFHDLSKKDVLYFETRNQQKRRESRAATFRGRIASTFGSQKSRGSSAILSPVDIIF